MNSLWLILRIIAIKDMLFTRLFIPVINKLDKYKIGINSFEGYNYGTSQYRSKSVQLNLYSFVIDSRKYNVKLENHLVPHGIAILKEWLRKNHSKNILSD